MVVIFWIVSSLILREVSSSDLTCNSGGVLCVATPSGCTSDCDFLLKYVAASDQTTQIEMYGKLASHDLSSATSSDLWLAFGLSDNGKMSPSLMIYACQLVSGTYTARKLPASGYAVSNSQSAEINNGDLVGSVIDETMSCSYILDNSHLSSEDKKVILGMGTMSGENSMNKHSQTPTSTANSISLIQQFGQRGCDKPSVTNSNIQPASDTIASGEQYTISCQNSFTISGEATITCTDGTLSTLPTCVQNPSPCNTPVIENGSVNPKTATIESGAQYAVSCNDGLTISGDSSITCTDGTLSTLPTCSINDVTTCNKPDIPDGTVKPDPGPIATGETYTVTCSNGFTISDDPNIMCTDGQLAQPYPQCSEDSLPLSCSKPDISDGSVEPADGTIGSGEEYTMSCDEGFSLNGHATVTCSEGSLSSLPTCLSEKQDDAKDQQIQCDLTGNCFSYPRNCNKGSSCSYTLEWSTDGNKINVELSGKPADYRLTNYENIWIGFGFSEYGTMTDSDIYLCLKTGAQFTAKKVKGYSHGLEQSGIKVLDDSVVGSYSDGVISCSYSIQNSDLIETLQPMFYGVGPADNSGNAMRHIQTPSTTSQKFSFLSDEVDGSSSSTCVSIILLFMALAGTLY